MAKSVFLVLILVGLSCGYPFQDKLNYLRRLIRREAYNVWNMEQYPNPKIQFGECNRRSPSMVCDPDRILTDEQANNLDFIISQIKNETVCVCSDCSKPNSGISVAVAVMNHMYHDYHDDLSIRAEDFAKGLSKKWEFGQCKDYIIILLATDEKQSFILSGETVHGVLSENKISEIFEEIKDHFKTGAYYQGLESLIKSIYDNIRVVLKAPTKAEDETNQSNVGLTVGLVVGFVALAALFAVGVLAVRRRQRRAGGGDKFMFDSHKTNANKSNIVKVPVVFPDAVYQPCSIEDPAGGFKRGNSDEEINFEERKSSDSKAPLRDQLPDVHNGHMRHELSSVEEEDSKDILEEIDVDDPDEKIVFAQTHPPKPSRKNESGPRV